MIYSLPKTSWDCKIVLDNISNSSSFTLSCICITLVPKYLVPQVHIHCDYWILLSGTSPTSHVGLLAFGSQVDLNTTFYLLCWFKCSFLLYLLKNCFSFHLAESYLSEHTCFLNSEIHSHNKWRNSHCVRYCIEGLDNILSLDLNVMNHIFTI